jgi:hypothetical protein
MIKVMKAFGSLACKVVAACIAAIAASSAAFAGWDTGLPASMPEVARVESAKAIAGRMIADSKAGRLAESSTATAWGPAKISAGLARGKPAWVLEYANVPGRECSMIVARAGRDFDAVSVGSVEMGPDDLGDYARDGAFVGSCAEFGNAVKFSLAKK